MASGERCGRNGERAGAEPEWRDGIEHGEDEPRNAAHEKRSPGQNLDILGETAARNGLNQSSVSVAWRKAAETADFAL